MKKWFLTSLILILSATLLWGQPVLSGPGAPLTLTFNGFGGAGFSPTPASDQLNSDAWAATGFSDGDLAFGQTIATGDYARGITTGTGESGGGIYGLDDGTNQALWIQPGGSDFTPGSLTLRFVNGTGGTITSLDVAYDLIVLNDADRANTFDGSFSTDGTTFNPVASLAYLSPETSDGSTATNNLTATISGLSVAPNDTLYLRWDSDDNLGSGSRDEFGLDNITLTGNTGSVSLAANFVAAAAAFDEGAGTVSVDVSITTADTCQVGVALGMGGTATDGTDFTFGGDTLFFSPNGSTTLSASLDLIDDMMIESDETLFLVLDSVFNCSIGMADTFELTIQDNDLPVYDIDLVTNDADGDGVGDSLGVECELRGVVYGVDLNGGTAIQFTFIDQTGGIGLFSGNDFGYTVTEGDSIHVQGTITEFNGLTQISPDTLAFISGGNALQTPSVITTLDESTESELVRFNDGYLVDPAQWTGSGSGFNVEVTNGTDTIEVRIDDEVDLYSLPAPVDTFDVIGLGGQFDNSTPATEGYQLLPRTQADIIPKATNTLPVYPIGLVTNDANGDGVGDSLGVECELRGVVHGIDLNGGGSIQFTFIDGTGGIGLFSSNNFGYTVQQGDSIHVPGTITEFNGLTQISPDTVILISQNNPTETPLVITSLDESTESELVRFNDGYLVDPAQWTGSGSGFNVDVTDGLDTIVVRIDNEVDLYNLPAPLDTFDVIGLGGQFDNSPPATEGYQLLPRDQFDLIRTNADGLPIYPIGLVTNDSNGDGEADSLGVACELRGVVHGVDLNGGGAIQFTFIDPTGGIGLFSSNDFGYTVTEGDSVHIPGTISQFNGLAQMSPDTVIVISPGNATATPQVITSLDETTESELIRFNNATLVDPTDWPTTPGSANVEITNGVDTILMRIDSDTDIDGTPAPSGTFDVIGLGGQFDNSFPYNDGYQLLPRYQQDIIPVVQPGFSISPTAINANEGDGTITFEVALATAFANPTTVEVNLLPGGTALDGTDFTGWNDTVLNFPANSNGPFQLTLDLVDDNLIEGVENILIGLANPTGGPTLGDSVITITIEDNDFAAYDIGLITDDSDGDGLADSLGVVCEIRGVVHGIDFRGGSGIELILIDNTGGITVFEFDDVSGYGSSSSIPVSQGDEFIIRGEIDQFNGLAQMRPDTLIRVSTGNTLQQPMLVTTLDETTEAEHLRMECFKLVDPSAWPGSGSSSNLQITNTVDTVTMRIDSDTDIDGTPVPTGYFNLIGTGGQFDNDGAPFTNGYQIRPSFISDIEEFPNPEVSLQNSMVSVDEDADTLRLIVFQENGNPEPTQVRSELLFGQTTATEAVDFAFAPTLINLVGCGANMDTFELKIPIFDDTDVEGDETFTIRIFGATNNATLDIDTVKVTIVDNDQIGIESLPQQAVRMYPNPARQQVQIESGQRIESITLTNLMGQQMLRVQPHANQSSLNLRNLPAGMYSLRVQTAQGTWTDQLMIQR